MGEADDYVDGEADTEEAPEPVIPMPCLLIGPYAQGHIKDRQRQSVPRAVREIARNARKQRDDQRRVRELDDGKARRPLRSRQTLDCARAHDVAAWQYAHDTLRAQWRCDHRVSGRG